jgi:hypothetical protein
VRVDRNVKRIRHQAQDPHSLLEIGIFEVHPDGIRADAIVDGDIQPIGFKYLLDRPPLVRPHVKVVYAGGWRKGNSFAQSGSCLVVQRPRLAERGLVREFVQMFDHLRILGVECQCTS